MFERYVQCDIGYVDWLIAQQVNCWMLMLYDDVAQQIASWIQDSYCTAGPEVDAGA